MSENTERATLTPKDFVTGAYVNGELQMVVSEPTYQRAVQAAYSGLNVTALLRASGILDTLNAAERDLVETTEMRFKEAVSTSPDLILNKEGR